MFKFIIQLHKKGGGTTTVESYKPTAEEIRLQKQAADYAEAVAPNALWLNNLASGILKDSVGATQVDFNSLNNTAQGLISNAQSGVQGLTNGQLPAEYQQNMENSIKSSVQNSMGNMLTSLGDRGVLNSSVTNKGIQGINDSAASAMSDAYQQNISLLSQLYGQQTDSATSGIAAGAAAQEAAQQPALKLWQASLGLNDGGTMGALNAVAGQGTKTAKTSGGGGGLFGGVLSGLASNSGLFCFTEKTKIKTPDGDVEIRKLNVGDKVITASGEEESIIEVMTPHYSDVYTVVCNSESGEKRFVNTTLTQPLLTSDDVFVEVSKMHIGTKLKGVGTVLSVIYSGERKVYDLKVAGDNTYYADGFIAKGATNEW